MTQRTTSETLRLREGQAREAEGTVEVVYADAYDELCEAAAGLAAALIPFTRSACSCEGDTTCKACVAKEALRRYEEW